MAADKLEAGKNTASIELSISTTKKRLALQNQGVRGTNCAELRKGF